MSNYDAIILGSSPNALTTANYLARAGKKVLVLEKSENIGGAVATPAFADGFMGDIGLTSGRLDDAIIKDFKLHEHGLEIIERSTITSLLPDGRSFTLPADYAAAGEVIKTLSPRDAARFKPFMELMNQAADFLQTAYSITPPLNHPPAESELKQLSKLVAQLRGYGKREMTEIMRVLLMSLRDLLDEWFESAQLKGLLAGVGLRGVNQGPFAGSTTFNLLHQLAIGNGLFCATARGGVGAISKSLASSAKSSGVEIRTNTNPLHINVSNGTATGVQIGSGEAINAELVISDYDARHTFSTLIAPPELEPEFNRALKHIRYNSSVARINLGLREVPKFTGLSEPELKGSLIIAPDLEYLERTFDAGKYGEISNQPFIEISIPSLSDTSLAPADKHVMSLWLQYVPFKSKASADQVLKLALDCVSKFAPELETIIEHSQVILPQDFETRFNLSEGNLYGGEMNLAQVFYLRPVPGFAQYHSPIKNLYLCGFATHPGGGIHGLAGSNLSRELGVMNMVTV